MEMGSVLCAVECGGWAGSQEPSRRKALLGERVEQEGQAWTGYDSLSS